MMKTIFKWAARVFGAIGIILAGAFLVVFWASESRLDRTYDVQPRKLTIQQDTATLAHGRHIATVRGCTECHGENLAGRVFLDSPMIGRFVATNLTRGKGGVGATFSDSDWVRAVRHGVRPNGKPLMIMPSNEFFQLSDSDLAAAIAYVKSVPAVDNELPASRISVAGRALVTLNRDIAILPAERINHDASHAAVPAAAVTPEYGAYLATGCTTCHGATFSGGKIPGVPPDWPPAANLTPAADAAISRWNADQFTHTLRTGITPEGRQLNKKYMPWIVIGKMTDDELRALWLYFRSVPAKPHGNR
jgi:mono/diheme cytochrome c family protein